MKKLVLFSLCLILLCLNIYSKEKESFEVLKNITKNDLLTETKTFELDGKTSEVVFYQGNGKCKYGIGTKSAQSALSNKLAIICSDNAGSKKSASMLTMSVNKHESVNRFKAEMFLNSQFSEVVKNISSYRGVIFSGGYNYGNKIDYSEYAKELYDYVEKGGFVFVSDAIIPPQYEWIEKAFKSRFIGNIPSTDGVDSNEPKPDLPFYFLERIHWNSFFPYFTAKEVSDDFTAILTGKNGVPNYVTKDIGLGKLYVTTLSNSSGILNDNYLCDNLLPEIGKQNNADARIYSDDESIHINLRTVLSRKGEPERWHGMTPYTFAYKPRLTEWSGSYDDNGLYFTVKCEDDCMEEIVAKDYGMVDGSIFDGDSIMLLIFPNAKFPIMRAVSFGVNPNNAHFSFCPYFESKVTKDEFGWTCEMFIPYSSLNIWKDREWIKAKIDGKTMLPFDFNIIRYAHKEGAIYNWAAISNQQDPFFLPKIADNRPVGDYSMQGEIYIEDMDFSKYTVPLVTVQKTDNPVLGINDIKIISRFLSKDYAIDKYVCEIYDATEDKTYKAEKGIGKVKFAKKGVHYLFAKIYDGDKLIGASVPYEFDVQ